MAAHWFFGTGDALSPVQKCRRSSRRTDLWECVPVAGEKSSAKSRPPKVAREESLGCCRSEGISTMTLLPLVFAAILYFNERQIARYPAAIQLEPEPVGEVSPFAAVADAASLTPN